MPLLLSSDLYRQIQHHAEKEYPKECCGLGFSSKESPDVVFEILECKNVQDDFHREDSLQYPRTSKNAYLIDPLQLLEAHHRIPLCDLEPGTKTKLSDLAMVCANCHRMLHRGNPWPTVDKLKLKIEAKKLK